MGVLGTAMETDSWAGEMRALAGAPAVHESRLLAAMAAGDREAAERLVERTYRGVHAFLRRLCGDSELAADLTQETYRKAWSALSGFAGQAQFSTWLCRIAYNVFLNHLRRPRRLVPLEERSEGAIPDPSPAADDLLDQAAEGDRLRRAVLLLPEEQRFTVTALYWGERSVREIALEQGVSGVAIRKRLKRALATLAGLLAEEERR
ncbi:MAG: RNA polymerase sigma factor [Acidobacteria bacterium]|nr:RNA polymerase sigma factor [Acidobacteriota bacterium]